MGGYDMYLKKCRLPVTPGKIKMEINNTNETVTLINEGEVNLLKKAGLTDIEFECEIPQISYPYATYESGFKSAKYYLNYFEKLKKKKKPFQFIVCRQKPDGKKLFNTNIKVSLESYTITEDAKNGMDLTVKIKLKQWKEYGTKNVKLKKSKKTASVENNRETNNSPAPLSPQNYTVVSGDCLYGIARKFYGDGSKYTVIYDANRAIIGGNPNLIYPGQILTIPAV